MKTIEFGGGDNPKFRPNYDIRKLPNVDMVIDLNNPLPIPGEEYDLAYSRFLLEHIDWRNVKNFLKELYRILKPEGRIEILTSNLLEQAKVLIDTKEWNDNLIGMIFGGHDYNENSHQSGFSPDYMTITLTEIGFQNINIIPVYSDFGPTDMIIQALKPVTQKNIETLKNINTEVKVKPIQTINSNIDRRQWVLNRCKLGEKILDVGCADGWIFNNTPFRPYVTSIDLDVYDIPNFIQMDAHNLKFQDQCFDTVIVGELIEHVGNPVQVLKEAKRVGKRILITVPDEINWAPEYYPFETIEQGMKRRNLTLEQIVKVSNPNTKEFYTKDNYQHLFHNRRYTEDTLRQDLEKAGIVNYEMTRLQYSGWSFFTVEYNGDLHHQEETIGHKVIDQTIPKGPVITQGSMAPNNLKTKDGKEVKEDIIKDKLRVALISTSFFQTPPQKYGGLEQIVWDLAMGLDELGHEVTIFAPEGSKIPPHGHLVVTGPSIDTVGVNWLEEERKRYNTYKDIIIPDKYDVIHDHTWFSFIYLMKMKYHQLKVAHTHHGSFVWESGPPISKPNLVSISKFMQSYTIQYFRQRGYNINCEYVYNGIDLNKYSFDPNIKKTDRLLYVGRFSKFKQPHIAIRAAKRSNLPIDLIGGTFVDDINYLKEIESMCDNNNIVMYKDASHDFKIKKMQEAKALIFPSKFGEPLGLVAQEAMACGTAVIATIDGAIPEVVIHNKTGFICDTEEEIVEAIKNIDKIDPIDCRKHAEEFSRLKMAENYVKLYHRMLNDDSW